MSTFLFTAVDRDGKSVTQRIEAENLKQARYKLDIRGYSEISFYESELSSEVSNLFGKEYSEAKNKNLQNQVSFQFDNSLTHQLISLFKMTWLFWSIAVGCLLYAPNAITWMIVGFCVFTTAYLMLPVIISTRLHEAHCWHKNALVRFWGSAAKLLNPVSITKIPDFEIDSYLANADARDGNLKAALQRMAKYENDSTISRRLLYIKTVRIYANARDYEKAQALLEKSLNEGNVYEEELIDYAIGLARYLRQPARAKDVLQKVFESELTVAANLFLPYCQGVIEFEDGNYSQAEFYLKQACRRLEPFRKNSFLIGLKSEVKAFLALALGRQGETDEAQRLFEEAKPYLISVRENELLQRCEEALA